MPNHSHLVMLVFFIENFPSAKTSKVAIQAHFVF